jgi:plastocyanin
VLVGVAVAAISSVHARPAIVRAFDYRVTIVDNNARFSPADAAGRASWGFSPAQLNVVQGTQVEFNSPSTNFLPHTVTSLVISGRRDARKFDEGTKFDSSPNNDPMIMPGDSWILDTTDFAPGNYLYICALHVWMTGTITVVPAQ